MADRTTIILADDHALVRGAVKTVLEREADLAVVAEVGSADEAVAETLRLKPDVVLLDIEMPGQHSFEAARTIKSRLPETRVVFLSGFHHDRYIEQAILVQASGYLSKGEPPQRLVEAIRAVMAGGVCYSPEIQARIVIHPDGRHKLSPAGHTRVASLTEKELAVLRYIARGLSKKEIAVQMSLTLSAIDRHCTRLMAKLDIHDRVDLTKFAIREGLAEP
ncbi:MAG TPA: response regulator transcription factor [Phycisphaerae bacterium]|nr:response regulator transcription factor [Phycisphaerae bacterium]HRY71140.1 response regulator transcription factor [Phycisphaerae bacterium]HSA29772.1 response regulator transcription factor [Phycisphaerae bacterium]